MTLNLRALLVALVCAMGLFFSGDAHAQSCSTFLQDRINWIAQYSDHYLDIKGTSLNANQSLVSYVEGYLMQYTPSTFYFDVNTGRVVTVPPRVSGTNISQTFSDRYATGYQPFAVNQADLLGISIYTTGKITITLQSWGNGVVTIDTTSCVNDVIYGASADGTFWSFRLYKGYIPG